MHQFPDAIDAYENLLDGKGQHFDFVTGFNLILCYHALGDKERMKQGFVKLLQIQQPGLEDEEEQEDAQESTAVTMEKLAEGDDALREDVKRRQREAQTSIMNAASLIAPQVEKTAVGQIYVAGEEKQGGMGAAS